MLRNTNADVSVNIIQIHSFFTAFESIIALCETALASQTELIIQEEVWLFDWLFFLLTVINSNSFDEIFIHTFPTNHSDIIHIHILEQGCPTHLGSGAKYSLIRCQS